MTVSRRKGTAFESAIRDYLNGRGYDAWRTALSGARDTGDVYVPAWQAIIEAKATREINLASAVDEAQIEAQHAGAKFGIAVIKRRMKSVGQAYAVMPLDVLIELLENR